MASLFNSRGEFRVVALYIPAVLLYGLLANIGVPVVEVIWDMVFYKAMAFALGDPTTFDLRKIYPMPPLYPALLSIAHWLVSSYRAIEFVQSWLNPLIYFLGLFPLYHLSRWLLAPKQAALACVLYVIYPASVYTQWSLSENLAAPLSLWAALLFASLLLSEKPRFRDGAWLGLVMALMALTRIQAIVMCAALLGWIGYRFWRLKRDPAPLFLAYGAAITLVILVWGGMGYLSDARSSPFYFDLTAPTSSAEYSAFPLFWTLIAAHWAGLWIEGGLLIAALLLAHPIIAYARPSALSRSARELGLMSAVVAWVLIVFVGFYYVLRQPYEDWSISLRYTFYANRMFIPVAVWWLGRLPSLPTRERWMAAGSVFAAALLIWLAMLLPDVWTTLGDNRRFFTNAPALDFMSQLRNQGVWKGGGLLFGLATVILGLWFFTRRVGFIILAIAMLYVHAAAVDMAFSIRQKAVETLGARAIHEFCAKLETGEWSDIRIYCKEDFPYLRPNLSYWVDRFTYEWPTQAPYPAPPFLLLTWTPHDEGELVFERDPIRAYYFPITELNIDP